MRAETRATFLRQGGRVALRRVAASDQEEFVGLVEASRALHRPWIVVPRTPEEFRTYLSRFDQTLAEGFVICLPRSGAIVGFVNVNEIVRHPYQRGIIGYGAFASTVGLGYMTEGVSLLLDYGFKNLGLHRIEADIQPGNTASLNLVRRLKFHREGFSRGFICIDGKWMDHERWAITSDILAAQPPRSCSSSE
ncbi:GNAT family N-acetyltransferase [Actinomadura macra]|uniref:GNAT family N-acetyltransferase n=1 Tax=Actinomadura macra TaxID=46164 RepID=UPI000836B54F|nr:GNAT family protein [Actinomadura macra]